MNEYLKNNLILGDSLEISFDSITLVLEVIDLWLVLLRSTLHSCVAATANLICEIVQDSARKYQNESINDESL